MSDAEDAYGTKVWVQLEWEQVDAMIVKELKYHIHITARDVEAAKKGEGWIHPEDAEYNPKLLSAMFIVYEHWAGEAEADRLKKELDWSQA